jgi:hypothetical protein
MNEQIKKLANQAGFIGDSMYPIFGTCQETALNNFAELIIEQCAALCWNSGFSDGDVHAQNLLYEFNINNCRSYK